MANILIIDDDIQFRTMDELGQKGFQALRQLKAGVFDIMEMQLGYISGEDPFFQGSAKSAVLTLL